MSEKEKGTNNSRFREIISVLRKHNITRGLSPKKLRLIMEDLGPTFVKIGQIMALHSDILPKAYCDELMELCTAAYGDYMLIYSIVVYQGTRLSLLSIRI